MRRASWQAVALYILLCAHSAAQSDISIMTTGIVFGPLFVKANDVGVSDEFKNALINVEAEWSAVSSLYTNTKYESKQFSKSMSYNKDILNNAIDSYDNESLTAANYVLEDLRTKAEFINITSNYDKKIKDIQVTVKTLIDGNEVSGYYIGFNPRRYRGNNPLFPFSNPTSPSTDTLPPGNYEMVVTKDGSIVQRQEVRIGAKGVTEEDIICALRSNN